MMLYKLLFLVVNLIPSVLLIGNNVIIDTPNGQVEGIESNGLLYFKGIPYAEPPVGNLRWSRPVPKKPWAPNVLDATSFGNCCMQSGKLNGSFPLSEDCLYLNVYSPTNISQLSPVMVFIHGGAWIYGCSAQQYCYGDFYANSTNTVLVTLNYRLTAFGFLCNRDNGIDGNFGFYDQILALQWVQQNIKYFGGDPQQVTLFGQSAGGISLALHLTSPLSQKYQYFSRAIIESDPVTLQVRTPEEMVSYSKTFAGYLGCDISDMQCLQAADANAVIGAADKTWEFPYTPSEALTALPWEPVIDEEAIVDQPLDLFLTGLFYQVPTIVGTCKTETLVFEGMLLNFFGLKSFTKLDYEAAILVFFQLHGPTVLSLYPATGEDATDAVVSLSTDYLFSCPSRAIAASVANVGQPIFLYHFDHTPANDPLNPPLCHENGTVCHAAELTFVFHSDSFYNGFVFNTDENNLSWQMVNFWASFAHGRLNQSEWPQYVPYAGELSMAFDIPSYVQSQFNKAKCDFWDSIGYDW